MHSSGYFKIHLFSPIDVSPYMCSVSLSNHPTTLLLSDLLRCLSNIHEFSLFHFFKIFRVFTFKIFLSDMIWDSSIKYWLLIETIDFTLVFFRCLTETILCQNFCQFLSIINGWNTIVAHKLSTMFSVVMAAKINILQFLLKSFHVNYRHVFYHMKLTLQAIFYKL